MKPNCCYSPVKQLDFRDKWEGVGMYSVRAITTIWFHRFIGLSLRLQCQNRTDVSKGYILEGALGVTIKINRSGRN